MEMPEALDWTPSLDKNRRNLAQVKKNLLTQNFKASSETAAKVSHNRKLKKSVG